MKHYIKPDLFTIIVSSIVLIVLVYLIVRIIQNPHWILCVAGLVVFISLVYFGVKMPIYTYIDKDTIKIKQLTGSKIFSRDTVSTQKISKLEMKGTVRMFGSGGAFGYIGWFNNSALGNFYMIAGNKKDLLLITKVTGKKYVINCPIE